MTVAVAVAMMASGLCVYVAALSRRFSLAPGWHDQQWFSLAALTAALYSALNVPILMVASPAVAVGCARVQLLAGGIHVAAWIQYAPATLREPLGRRDRLLAAGAVALGLIAQIPGVVYTGAVDVRPFELLRVIYRDPATTRFGDVALLAIVAGFVPVLARFVRATRRGTPHAMTHAVAIGALLCLTVNDALVAARVFPAPYLIDLAYVIPVGAVGYVLTARFAADARALVEMRAHLETLVERRTRELDGARDALHRSEKLASLGQLAAGVAHEVSSPAAVVSANLSYLEQRLGGEGLTPADGLECVRESSVALRRISTITRQLLDAGQLAGTGKVSQRVALARVAREALSTARARCPPHISLVSRVPEDLWAVGQEDMLHQVLVNLVVNGIQAVPGGRAGRVEVRGERLDRRVLVTVEDDGEGMAPEVLRRVFEPFFTTKPFGAGTGLGLAVSRGLISGLGGDLRLESERGRGTRALVELPEAEREPESLTSASGA